MTYKEAKAYLQPIADNATLTGYREALCKAIEALEKVERLEEELWKATNNCDFCIKMAELDYSIQMAKLAERTEG